MKYFKFYIPVILLLLLGGQVFGQAAAGAEAAGAKNPDQLYSIMTLVIIGLVGIVLLVALWSMLRANTALYSKLERLTAEAKGIPLEDFQTHLAYQQEDSFWTKMRKRYWEDAVPIEREGDILLDHGFDGIRELDNSLPPWWLNMFYITIVWSVGYMFYYHWSDSGWSSDKEYKDEMDTAKKEIALAMSGKADAVDENNVVRLTESAALSDGELIYKTSCVACHGAKGEGGVGPNMTDANWIHGGGIKNIFRTIKVGVPEKGMISWASQLKPSDMQKVASYIMTLEGTNPPGAKPPQGDIWKEEATTPADTTAAKTAPAPATTGK